MSDYKLYFLDDTGHIARAMDLECHDDIEAIALARSYPCKHGIELWQRARKVGTVMGAEMTLAPHIGDRRI